VSSDIVLAIVDAVRTIESDVKSVLRQIEELHQEESDGGEDAIPKILVLNKMDLTKNLKDYVPVKDRFLKHFPKLLDTFEEIFYISALTGEHCAELKEYLLSNAQPGDWEFAPNVHTDLSQLKIATEIIREKLFRHLNKEIPYSIKQENLGWTICPNGDLRIDQKLILAKHNHIRVVIGRNGEKIFAITTEARRDISVAFNKKVHLFFSFKVSRGDPHLQQEEEAI